MLCSAQHSLWLQGFPIYLKNKTQIRGQLVKCTLNTALNWDTIKPCLSLLRYKLNANLVLEFYTLHSVTTPTPRSTAHCFPHKDSTIVRFQMQTSSICFLSVHHVSSISHVWNHLIFTTILGGSYHCYPHFIIRKKEKRKKKKQDMKMLGSLPKVIEREVGHCEDWKLSWLVPESEVLITVFCLFLACYVLVCFQPSLLVVSIMLPSTIKTVLLIEPLLIF